MDRFLKDLKHSCRMFLHLPGFTIAAVDRKVIGTRITLGGEAYKIIGVPPASLRSSQIAEQSPLSGDIEIVDPPDVYPPLQIDPNSADRGHYLNVAGRLKPGVTLEAANEQLRAYPEYARRFTVVPAILTAVALFAVWLPAMRASRIDPMQALRHE